MEHPLELKGYKLSKGHGLQVNLTLDPKIYRKEMNNVRAKSDDARRNYRTEL
jgi:hypothetical protein